MANLMKTAWAMKRRSRLTGASFRMLMLKEAKAKGCSPCVRAWKFLQRPRP